MADRTRNFRAGAPHAVTISGRGDRIMFLRSTGPQDPIDRFWTHDVASGTERMIGDPTDLVPGSSLTSYATDRAGRIVAMAAEGTLLIADLTTGRVTAPTTPGPVHDPRPDPDGTTIAYAAAGALWVHDLAAQTHRMLAGEPSDTDVTWGLPDVLSTRAFGQNRGFWWSPESTSMLAARVSTAPVRHHRRHDSGQPDSPVIAFPIAGSTTPELSLHLLDLDDGWVDVHWNREVYPYVVAARWDANGGPLIAVLRRSQQHGLVLAIDPRTGETQVHAELADPRWVHLVPGTPRYLTDGRVLAGGELAHDGYDARCLFADGGLLTPPSLYVRRVCGRLGPDLLVEASDGEPGEQHLYRVVARSATAGIEVHRITTEPGWHVGRCGGDIMVIGQDTLDHSGTRWRILRHGTEVGTLRDVAADPPFAPRPVLDRVTDRRLPTGVLYPRDHVTGRRRPVLVDVHGGHGLQKVTASRGMWQDRQWWADQGFIVVTIDNRGTPGVAPSFEKVIHRRLADMVLTDQVEALTALSDKHPDLDLDRVAIRGWALGGWLAALAVLARPDAYHCGVARTPVSDWSLCDTALSERYLGHPDESSDIYAHHDLIDLATLRPDPGADRPLLVIHDRADETVLAAHTLRLSAALASAGRTHSIVSVTGAGHTAVQAPTAALRLVELDFLRRGLGTSP